MERDKYYALDKNLCPCLFENTGSVGLLKNPITNFHISKGTGYENSTIKSYNYPI